MARQYRERIIPNVVRGGRAIPINGKPNYYYMVGRKHKNGGIDIGSNPRTGFEVEDGEIMQMGQDGSVKIYSANPMLGGVSPAERVLDGYNPNAVFNAQEAYKDANKLNDDGSKKKAMGGGLSRSKDYGSKSKSYPSVKSSDFAGGSRSYPIPTKADAVDALRLAGLHGRSDVKAKVYRKYPSLKRNKHDGGGKETAQALPATLYDLWTPAAATHSLNRRYEPVYSLTDDNGNLIVPEDVQNYEQQLADFDSSLASQGFTKKQRASIIANAMVESEGNPKAIQKNWTPGSPNYGRPSRKLPGRSFLQTDSQYFDFNDGDRESDVLRAYVDSLASQLPNATDGHTWHHGGTGSGYTTAQDARDTFYNDTLPLDSINHAFVYGHERPKEKVNNTKNRGKIANTLYDNNLIVGDNIGQIIKNGGYKWLYKPAYKNGGRRKAALEDEYHRREAPDHDKAYQQWYERWKNRKFIWPVLPNATNVVIPAATVTATKNSGTNASTWNPAEAYPYYTVLQISGNSNTSTNGSTTNAIDTGTEATSNGGRNGRFRTKLKDHLGKNGTISDLIGLGSNTLGSLASSLITNRAINKLKYSNPPTPKRAAKLKTRYNINPQLANIRESTKAFERNVDSNTSSSQAALSRKRTARLQALNNANTLYGQKENIETQLINQDRMNQQQVANANVDAYNQYLSGLADFNNNKTLMRSNNWNTLINNLNSGVQDTISKVLQRRRDNQTISAMALANPNLPAELFYEQGLINKRTYDAYRKAYPLVATV